jgi:urease accessory protein
LPHAKASTIARGATVKLATRIVAADQWDCATAIDRVMLDADERYCRRAALEGEQGTVFLLDLPQPTTLRDRDGLVLDDGTIVRVESRSEQLVEISAAYAHELARFAWHLGNRHANVQVIGCKLRIRRDHVLEAMLLKLGAEMTPVEAPFDPERGAYHRH